MCRVVKWCIIAVLLIIAVAVSFVSGCSYQNKETFVHTITKQAERDQLAAFCEDRQKLRQNQISQMNGIIHAHTDEQVVSLAQMKLIELMTSEEQEMVLEGMLALRGFSDSVVVVHSGSVNVMVRSETLTAQQAALILEMVTRETGISAGNVKIIPIN